MKSARVFLVILTVVGAGLLLALIVSAGRAAEEASGTSPNIILAVDATAGMADEVSALTTAWDNVFGPAATQSGTALSPSSHCNPFCPPLTATFRLISFRDQVAFVGATDDGAQMSGWLSSLRTGEDGTCRDHALGALWQAAHLSPRNPLTSTETLLLTDSAPWGHRAALARTINLLNRAHVVVNPVVSGWCPGAPLPAEMMTYLAAGTGGLPPLGLSQSPTLTLQILLSDMNTADIVALNVGGGQAFDDVHGVPVDSSVERLDITVATINDPCSNPLFPCPSSQPDEPAQPESVTVQVRDPGGNLVIAGTEGVNLMETESIYSLRIDRAAYPGPMTGSFTVEIEGLQSGYVMRASASSEINLTLLSPHTVPVGRPATVVVGLLLPAVQSAVQSDAPKMPLPTEELFGAYNFSTGEFVPLALEDDGSSGDGQAGDGVYGGVWQPSPGLWQIWAYGQLEDGSAFQRVVAAPVRAQRLRMEPSGDNAVMPGDNVQLAFSLTNEENESQTFELDLASQMGWVVTGSVPASVTLAAGETAWIEALLEAPTDAQAGLVEETTLTALPAGDNPLESASSTVSTTVVDTAYVYLPVSFKPAD